MVERAKSRPGHGMPESEPEILSGFKLKPSPYPAKFTLNPADKCLTTPALTLKESNQNMHKILGSYIAQAGIQEPPPPCPPPPPHFYRSIYSEIEEVGWENLVKSEEDLSSLSFRILDKKGRTHIMEIVVPPNYPECPPSIAADVPHLCELDWSKNSRLKDAVHQFIEHLDRLQEFWSTLDDIDRALWVVGPRQPSFAAPYRQISLGNDCYLLFSIDACNPRSLPECRFLGPDSRINLIRKNWKKNSRRCYKISLLCSFGERTENVVAMKSLKTNILATYRLLINIESGKMNGKPFHENLATMLDTTLPRPPAADSKEDEQPDCGICYAQYLPVDDELGDNSGSAPDYICDNHNCSRAFHIICLRDWLRSITTTRQSFDVLFGNCPYCSEPVAVKVNYRK